MATSNRLVQSCLNTVSYPESIAEFRAMVEWRFEETGSVHDSLNTDAFYAHQCAPLGEVVTPVTHKVEQWTSPRWFTVGDVAFFYHARRAIKNSRAVLKQLVLISRDAKTRTISLDDGGLSVTRRRLSALVEIATRGHEFALQYAGTIFAIGRACGGFANFPANENQHWVSRYYCDFDDVRMLENPIQLEDFKPVAPVSQSTITPLTRVQFEHIQERVMKRNPDIGYLQDLRHRDARISDTAKQGGWRCVATDYAPIFLFENQVREYLIDPFLKEVVDEHGRVLTEVRSDNVDGRGFIDYVLVVEGRFIAIEVKCVAYESEELQQQLEKYCSANIRWNSQQATTASFCLLMDNEDLWLFKSQKGCSNEPELRHIRTFQDLSLEPIEKIRSLLFDPII